MMEEEAILDPGSNTNRRGRGLLPILIIHHLGRTVKETIRLHHLTMTEEEEVNTPLRREVILGPSQRRQLRLREGVSHHLPNCTVHLSLRFLMKDTAPTKRRLQFAEMIVTIMAGPRGLAFLQRRLLIEDEVRPLEKSKLSRTGP